MFYNISTITFRENPVSIAVKIIIDQLEHIKPNFTCNDNFYSPFRIQIHTSRTHQTCLKWLPLAN